MIGIALGNIRGAHIERHGAGSLLLLGVDEKGNLWVASIKRALEPKAE